MEELENSINRKGTRGAGVIAEVGKTGSKKYMNPLCK